MRRGLGLLPAVPGQPETRGGLPSPDVVPATGKSPGLSVFPPQLAQHDQNRNQNSAAEWAELPQFTWQ